MSNAWHFESVGQRTNVPKVVWPKARHMWRLNWSLLWPLEKAFFFFFLGEGHCFILTGLSSDKMSKKFALIGARGTRTQRWSWSWKIREKPDYKGTMTNSGFWIIENQWSFIRGRNTIKLGKSVCMHVCLGPQGENKLCNHSFMV